jgi:hypothetical protein
MSGQPRRWLCACAGLSLLIGACTQAAPAPPPQPAGPAATATAAPAAAAATPVRGGATPTPAGPAPTPTRPPASPAGAPSKPSASNRQEVTLRFAQSLSTPEEVLEIADVLRRQPGILDVEGNERTITVGYDPGQRTPAQIADLLAAQQHPVQP